MRALRACPAGTLDAAFETGADLTAMSGSLDRRTHEHRRVSLVERFADPQSGASLGPALVIDNTAPGRSSGRDGCPASS
jgi:hypothetical protein